MTVRPSTVAHLAALTAGLPLDLCLPVVAQTRHGFHIVGAARQGHLDNTCAAVDTHKDTHNLYVNTTATTCDRARELRNQGQRGGKDDAAALLAVYADLDVAGPGHKTTLTLPPTVDAAREILDRLPTPSLVISTGGGLHAWWILRHAARIGTDITRSEADDLLAAWDRTVAHHANGYHTDKVGELARILRLCGTNNHKTTPPRPVTLEHVGGQPATGTLTDPAGWRPGTLYTVDQLARHTVAATPTAPTAPLPLPARNDQPHPGRHLDRLDPVPWGHIWPPGWTRGKDRTVDGQPVETWRRPGATSDYSAVCWPAFCHVHSDAVGWLPKGTHTKAQVLAARDGTTTSQINQQLRTIKDPK